jgi:hypothetical protein
MDYWYREASHLNLKVPALRNIVYGERTITDDRVGGEQREFSAAYKDPETNIYHVAEGGSAFDDEGLCWYPSKEAAKAALEFSYFVGAPKFVRDYDDYQQKTHY